MKKFFKILGSAALLCGTVAGGIFAYKKFFAPDPFDDDLDDDLEDDLEDSTEEEGEAPERGYVSLSPTEEAEEDTETPETEEAKETEAAEEAETEVKKETAGE